MWTGLLVVAIVVIAVGFRLVEAKRGNGVSPETPLGILQGRYARGEVSREEYERIRNDLSK